jgi:ribosomal-protein-alanine N-acetyltransferase
MLKGDYVKLIPCDDTIFDAIKMGDDVLAQVIGANVPKRWTEFRDAFTPAYKKWKEHPPLRDWWTYLIVHRSDNQLIGTCGYKGEPDLNGTVEIGYEIKSNYRNKGFGTEVARILTENAMASKLVKRVIAHTLPFENASTAVLRRAGYTMVQEVEDDAEGLAWKWEFVQAKGQTTYP